MGGIFISYRRDDAQGEARHLFDDLKQRFGGDRVFMDVIGIRPGEDYRKVIDSAVASCEVLITLIGKEWLKSTTAAGQPRLNDPRDFVRLETATALKRDVRVIPVLVQGAEMPTEDALPDDLKPLAFRNAIELSHHRWDYDVRTLVEALERVVTPAAAAPADAVPSTNESKGSPGAKRPTWRLAALGAAAACLLGGGGYWLWSPSGTSSPTVVSATRDAAPSPETPTSATPSPPPPSTPSTETPKASPAPKTSATPKRTPAAPARPVDTKPSPAEPIAAVTTVTVPDLVGKSRRDASLALEQEGLKVTWRRETTDEAKPDVVVRQHPAASANVQPGTTIEVTTAVPATFYVPKLTGMTRDDALSALERLSFKYRIEERPTASERPGVVVGQSPPAGTQARPGDVINVQVAAAELRTVVDLVGKSAREASELLQKADLRPTWVRETTEQVAAGVVLRQDPTAGARVSPGSAVTVTISTSASVEVPKLTGLTRVEAAERLKRAGLEYRWETTPSRQPAGVIVAQNPEPGVRVKRGGAILLTVAVSSDTSVAGRCISGYVWREAFSGDRVCVTPETRAQAASDNSQASRRIEPDPGKRRYGPDTCRQGYVWREAGPTDHICVSPQTRSRTAEDNRQAASRVAR